MFNIWKTLAVIIESLSWPVALVICLLILVLNERTPKD